MGKTLEEAPIALGQRGFFSLLNYSRSSIHYMGRVGHLHIMPSAIVCGVWEGYRVSMLRTAIQCVPSCFQDTGFSLTGS